MFRLHKFIGKLFFYMKFTNPATGIKRTKKSFFLHIISFAKFFNKFKLFFIALWSLASELCLTL